MHEAEVEETAAQCLASYLVVVTDKLLMKKAILTCHYKMTSLQTKIRNWIHLKRLRLDILQNLMIKEMQKWKFELEGIIDANKTKKPADQDHYAEGLCMGLDAFNWPLAKTLL
jgi:hypothetical protein